MNNKYVSVVVILVIFGLGIVGLSFMAKSISSTKISQELDAKLDDVSAVLSECDIRIYWIGDYPEELSKISSVVVRPDAVNEDTMPMKSPEFHTVEKDKDGNIIKERIPVEYPSFLYIVINRKVLTDEEYKTVRDCVADNGVNLIVIGGTAIDAMRNYLMLPKLQYTADDNMFYSLKDGSESHIYEYDKNARKNAVSLIEYIVGRTENTPSEESAADGN